MLQHNEYHSSNQWRIYGSRVPRTPLSVRFYFIFMQFPAKIMPNNRLVPPRVGAPCLANPGSATANWYRFTKCNRNSLCSENLALCCAQAGDNGPQRHKAQSSKDLLREPLSEFKVL